MVELLVVIAIIGVLIALLLPAVQAAREAARRMQCSNHLKQVGLAIHNFHDSRGGLPPAGVGSTGAADTARPGFMVLIWPYLEQQSLYDTVSNHGFDKKYGKDLWSGTAAIGGTDIDTFRKGVSSISAYRCPTRRGGGAQMNEPNGTYAGADDTQAWGIMPGPQTDYAYPISVKNSPAVTWHDYWNVSDANHYNGHSGPFRVATWGTPGDPNSWQPRDAFARMTDGTSNQLVFGEKHIPLGKLGRCESDKNGSDMPGDGTLTLDCSYLGSGLARGYPQAQPVRRYNAGTDGDPTSWDINVICRPTDYANATTRHPNDIGFGSYHSGVCQFTLGDGSVRALSVTMNRATFGSLSVVDDGVPVSF